PRVSKADRLYMEGDGVNPGRATRLLIMERCVAPMQKWGRRVPRPLTSRRVAHEERTRALGSSAEIEGSNRATRALGPRRRSRVRTGNSRLRALIESSEARTATTTESGTELLLDGSKSGDSQVRDRVAARRLESGR